LHPGGEESIGAYLGKDATADWQEIHRPEHLDKHWQHLKKMGKIKASGGLLSWLFGRIGSRQEQGPKAEPEATAESAPQVSADDAAAETAADEEVEPVRWSAEHEADLPPGGMFDLQELARWDGVNLPMCIGICGVIIDVSSSNNFTPNFGYGKLWAGKDTTWAMATVSLKAHDANKFDFNLEELSGDQAKALAGWYKHFTTKYRTVGTLKELRGRDFGSVERLAAELPASSMTTG